MSIENYINSSVVNIEKYDTSHKNTVSENYVINNFIIINNSYNKIFPEFITTSVFINEIDAILPVTIKKKYSLK
jgi:hypothetical protein